MRSILLYTPLASPILFSAAQKKNVTMQTDSLVGGNDTTLTRTNVQLAREDVRSSTIKARSSDVSVKSTGPPRRSVLMRPKRGIGWFAHNRLNDTKTSRMIPPHGPHGRGGPTKLLLIEQDSESHRSQFGLYHFFPILNSSSSLTPYRYGYTFGPGVWR